MRVLVLGGAGFIGSFLVESLLGDGHSVTVVDSFGYCYPDNLSAAEGAEVVREDCASPFWEIRGEYDAIYHLAGVVSARDFIERPLEAFWVSIIPLVKMLRYKEGRPEAAMLFASSSEVYGEAKEIPTPESYVGAIDPAGIRSGYDIGKLSGEMMIYAHARERGSRILPVNIVRIFNTFGPRMRANGRLVPTMVKDALEKGKIIVNLPGTQRRTLLYVDDCVRALRTVAETGIGGPVNIGGIETYTMWEVAEIVQRVVKEEAGIRAEPVVGEEIVGDIMDRKPDISKIESAVGWKPKISVEEGVRRTVRYWMSRV